MAGTNEANAVTDGGRFPIYVLLDTSASMSTHTGELHDMLGSLFELVTNDVQVYELAAICIAEFNSIVGLNTLIPLSRFWEIDFSDIKVPIHDNAASLIDPALKQIGDIARKDLHFNTADGYPADCRPLLVIISADTGSDGSASEDCHANTTMDPSTEAIYKLKSFPWKKVVACGMGHCIPSKLYSITENVVDFADIHNFSELIREDSARTTSITSFNDFV